MHPYIKHLLEDIENAERKENDHFGYPAPTTFEEEMEEVERYVSGEGELPISELTGLKREYFPPSERLTDEDMEVVLTAYDKMLSTWNTQIEWQPDMPVRAQYDFLLEFVLNYKIVPINLGTIHLDFCSGDSSDCEWGEYCSCKEHWDEDVKKID